MAVLKAKCSDHVPDKMPRYYPRTGLYDFGECKSGAIHGKGDHALDGRRSQREESIPFLFLSIYSAKVEGGVTAFR